MKTKTATSCRPVGDAARAAPLARRGGGLIAAIHTLKSRLSMADDDYRALLLQLTGQRSSKDCTPTQRQQVRDHLQKLAERMGVAQPGRSAAFAQKRAAASPRERKVWAIWLDMARRGIVRHKDSRALDGFVQRQTGTSALRFCSAAQLDAVIEALKLWQKRGHEVR
ncbi:regulatory protein GemA [Ottowia sp.]|uniref:regulatory protein GemA n=1 Tax=Ottowia sp. TaxID=1898956 RepID=UPI003A8B9F87